MGKQRQRRGEEFKAKVAMAAQQYHLYPMQITQWKQRLLPGAAELFQDGRIKKRQPREAISREDLLRQIGQLTVEDGAWWRKYAMQFNRVRFFKVSLKDSNT